MVAERFQSPRPDGRSNSQVVIDLVATEPLGTTFVYDRLRETLAEGTDREYTNTQVGAAVRGANRRLHRYHKRHLRPVATVGYRLAKPEEHTGLAGREEGKARRHIGQALSILHGTDLGALDAAQRQFHLAHLALTGLVFQQVSRLGRKQREMEATLDLVRQTHETHDTEIAQIKERLAQVEAGREAIN